MIDSAADRTVEPRSRAEWRAWLAVHADDGQGAWLVLYKGRNVPLRYEEAVEEALAAGWIDSRTNKLDAARYKLWMAPRKRGSGWASSNKERVSRLIEQDLMTPRGLSVVEAAKADGSWEALDAVMALEIPSDLAEAFAGDRTADANFGRFSPSVKRMILEWLRQAKGADTRRRRIEDIVRSAGENAKPGPWRRPSAVPTDSP